jgi:hypothetical protein
MEPWKFNMELMQQSGSEDELGGVVSVLMGQQACVWPRLGKQSALSPESCTSKAISRM